jgi:alpha-tubulin suppressor-like RCC1 family protein
MGNGQLGQLGHGAKSNALTPVRIEHAGMVVRVSCGGEHTAIIDELGRLSTFGFGFNGQLGHNDCHDVCTPTLVGSFEQTRVVHVACGSHHTIVCTQQGELFAFGRGTSGQLAQADNQRPTYQPVPNRVSVFCPSRHVVLRVVCGSKHTAVVVAESETASPGLADGHGVASRRTLRLYTFGEAKNGRLGYSGEACDRPTAVDLSGLTLECSALGVACGEEHTLVLCAEAE